MGRAMMGERGRGEDSCWRDRCACSTAAAPDAPEEVPPEPGNDSNEWKGDAIASRLTAAPPASADSRSWLGGGSLWRNCVWLGGDAMYDAGVDSTIKAFPPAVVPSLVPFAAPVLGLHSALSQDEERVAADTATAGEPPTALGDIIAGTSHDGPRFKAARLLAGDWWTSAPAALPDAPTEAEAAGFLCRCCCCGPSPGFR